MRALIRIPSVFLSFRSDTGPSIVSEIKQVIFSYNQSPEHILCKVAIDSFNLWVTKCIGDSILSVSYHDFRQKVPILKRLSLFLQKKKRLELVIESVVLYLTYYSILSLKKH